MKLKALSGNYPALQRLLHLPVVRGGQVITSQVREKVVFATKSPLPCSIISQLSLQANKSHVAVHQPGIKEWPDLGAHRTGR